MVELNSLGQVMWSPYKIETRVEFGRKMLMSTAIIELTDLL